MRARFRAVRSALAPLVMFAGVVAPGLSSAEIYGWIDSAGVVTYSNVPPPANVEVTQVIHEAPVAPAMAVQGARDSEVEALKDRIRLLELEQARAHRVSVDYPPAPAAAYGPPCGADCYADDGYYPGTLVVGAYGRYRNRGFNGHRPPLRGGGVAHATSMRASAR